MVPKTGPHSGMQKVRFCCYLLHLSQVGRLKKRPSLGTILGTGFAKKWKKGFSENRQKSVQKNTPKWTPKWDHLGVISRPISKQLGIWVLWGRLGSTLDRLGSILGSFWSNFGGHFLWFWMPFCKHFMFSVVSQLGPQMIHICVGILQLCFQMFFGTHYFMNTICKTIR